MGKVFATQAWRRPEFKPSRLIKPQGHTHCSQDSYCEIQGVLASAKVNIKKTSPRTRCEVWDLRLSSDLHTMPCQCESPQSKEERRTVDFLV